MQQQALAAIVAWVRLERAMEAYARALARQHGITPLQLAVLGLLAERPQLPLAALRKSLVRHPATLGQAIDALRVKGWCEVRRDAADRRARMVAITPAGLALVRAAPLAGPDRLRQEPHAVARLDRLSAALADAVELYGLGPWAPGRTP